MNHKISVALCTYNGEKFIKKQLESIFNQTLPVTEIIICDDGSTDNTEQIISSFHVQYPNIIQFHKNEINLRSVKNFEKAIKLSSGDYIFLCDQDDLWHINKVEKIINHFKENPTAEGVFTDAVLIDDYDAPIENYALWECCIFKPEMVTQCGSFWKTYQYYDNMVTGATMCIKKIGKDFIFPFPVSYEFHHDEWMALHFAERNTLHFLTEKLTLYRIHQSQQVGAGLIDRFNSEKEYIDMVMHFKKEHSFKMMFRVYKRVYALYNKHYQLMQNKDSYGIGIEKLVRGDEESLRNLRKSMLRKFPFNSAAKFVWDWKRDKRQIHKF
jgi:glycosyltransferase involved in cell wall biosynthesis